MVPEPANQKKNNHSADQRQLDREVREMLSTLTHRLTDLHHHSSNKSDSSTTLLGDDEEEHGVRIITLAGSNTGATMKAESDEKSFGISSSSLDQEGMTAYANSNFQAINNSIMLGGSYSCKDPGIHMETSDYVDEHHNKALNNKHGKKGKRKETETSKRDSHSTQDESSTDSD